MRKLFSVLSSILQGGVRGGLLFLALMATTCLLAEDFSVNGIYYKYLDGNNVAVTYRGKYVGSYDKEYSGAVTIPASVTYNGTTYSVTSIGDWAFNGCTSLTSITIPNSVTSIGSSTFENCTSLTSITIPNSVTSIENSAFSSCSSLTSITIPNSVTNIGNYAFYNCSSLTSVTIPNSVTSIGRGAFSHCYLTSVTIPNSVTSIENSAFSSCYYLTSITIPNSVTSIGNNAFSECYRLTAITIPNSVTSIGNAAFRDCSSLSSPVYNAHCFAYMPTSFKGAYTIPDGIKQIAGSAFEGCSSLTSITIPNSVTSIGGSAFYFCSSLTSITIPNSVTSIGYKAFSYCYSLSSITIPNSVTSIGDDAFSGCIFAMDNFINNSSLDAEANNYWDAEVGDVEIDGLLIRNNTLIYCRPYVTTAVIPESVTSIGEGAFEGCSSLTSVTIPNSVTCIGDWAFSNCSALKSITCEATIPPTVGEDAFYRVSYSIPVYVPCGRVNAYKAASDWKDFTNILEPLAEYSIEVNMNHNVTMGTAKVNYNTFCEGAQVSATPNHGYHFVQWSDGSTDNPRTLVLTQDTILTAEFAPNTYTITTVSCDTQRGTTQGNTTVNYLVFITISATANYGYHFVQWNDGNTENPRLVQVTGDKTYTAKFEKNTYSISLSCNEEQGAVESVSAAYLDTVTISATPNVGYHFVQWNDGNTDNPRTLVLTQDITLTAKFAQSFSGQCGENLYWNYDETTKTISITGSGKMYDYTAKNQPWLLFKEQIVEVTTTNTVTSIGTSAFEGCARLGKISLGTGLEEIAANAFAGCTRLYDIYTYATYPPFAEESSFANYNVYVYVPCEYQRGYTLDVVWGKFKFIECIDSEDATTDGNVTVDPGFNDVTITWPTAENADSYSLVINKVGEPFCTLTFNAKGQLLNIAFAPGRSGSHVAPYALQTVSGYRFTVTGLTEATKYAYDITTKDAAKQTIAAYSGEFTTKGGTTTAVEDILQNTTKVQKLLRNGQLIILRDGVEYNAMGQEM